MPRCTGWPMSTAPPHLPPSIDVISALRLLVERPGKLLANFELPIDWRESRLIKSRSSGPLNNITAKPGVPAGSSAAPQRPLPLNVQKMACPEFNPARKQLWWRDTCYGFSTRLTPAPVPCCPIAGAAMHELALMEEVSPHALEARRPGWAGGFTP